MKKFMSLLMAIVMVFTLATPVKAEQTFEIEHPGTNDHTYEIYQIFTGDLNSDGTVLSNVKWGVNGTGQTGTPVDTNTLQALKDLSDEELNSDQTQLATIEQYVTLTNPHKTLTKENGKVSVAAGYYLIKDVDGSLTDKDEAYTEYIVQIVNNVTISPKSVKPEVDKQVWDELEDGEINKDGERVNWGETADHDINETFQFKLIAKLTKDDNFAGYESYKVVFNDQMSAGITFENIVSVTIKGKNLNNEDVTATLNNTQYNFSGVSNQKFTITIADVKDYVDLTKADTTIEVIYEAHLNEDALINNEKENKNTVYLQYSNNPNASGEGDTNELGKTPEDHVWVFTYEVNGTKVDGAEKNDEGNYTKFLEGAEFVLYKKVGQTEYFAVLDDNNKVQGWTTDLENFPEGITGTATITSDDKGEFAIVGLDAGTYYLRETTAPDGYNLLTEDKVVTITAAHKELSTTTAETLNGTNNPSVNVTVENNKGATLPETGGMGTTLFYVFGSLLAVGAIVLLVTKKRMNEE